MANNSAYPWYSRAADVAHRLTVLGLMGFTLYMTTAISYNIWANGRENQRKLEAQKKQQEALQAAGAAGAAGADAGSVAPDATATTDAGKQ